MTEYIEIIPGESIGPFKLGMTREQMEKLDIRPRMDVNKNGAYYPLEDIDEEGIQSRASGFPRPGVHIDYDASGKCHRLRAIFGYEPYPPVFTLRDHVTNGMSGSKVTSILRSIASDVEVSYGSIESLSAGIRATKWEAGDEPIISIVVMPKTETTSHAG